MFATAFELLFLLYVTNQSHKQILTQIIEIFPALLWQYEGNRFFNGSGCPTRAFKCHCRRNSPRNGIGSRGDKNAC